MSGSKNLKYYTHLSGAKIWRKAGEMGQFTKNLVGHTEELGIYPEDNSEPLKDLNRRVTWSDLHFGKNALVENCLERNCLDSSSSS